MKGIREDDYEFYDNYLDCKEVLIVGASNAGKSSLINVLNDSEKVAKTRKKSGKTQSLNFYLAEISQPQYRRKNENYQGMLIDSPGYGYTYVPVKVKNQFKRLMGMYLSHAVRLSLVVMLVDAKTGLKTSDKEVLDKLAYYRKPVQVVFAKVDKLGPGIIH